MDLLVDSTALGRRRTTQLATRVLEAAIAEALGFSVHVQAVQLWASPTLFEENRVPERYLRLDAAPEHVPGRKSVIALAFPPLLQPRLPLEESRLKTYHRRKALPEEARRYPS